jgi:hypothetical protein
MQKLSGKAIDMLYQSCSVFTRNPTKLSLHFSDFSTVFYGFYKIQHLHLDLEETDLRTSSRISRIGHQDANLDCNWVPGTMTGGGSSISVRGRLGSAGKVRGSGVGWVPFYGLLAAEEQPVAVLGGAMLRRPLEWLSWRAPDLGKRWGGAVGSSRG